MIQEILNISPENMISRLNNSTIPHKALDDQPMLDYNNNPADHDYDIISSITSITSTTEEIIKYIAGFIVRKIEKKNYL